MKRLGFLLPFMFSKAFVRFINAPNQENNSTIKKVMEHTAPVLLIEGQWRDRWGENALILVQCHDIGNSD